jgi:hypothetical protein
MYTDTTESAKECLSSMWIVTDESGSIVGCAIAQINGDVVKIGPLAVKVERQVRDSVTRFRHFGKNCPKLILQRAKFLYHFAKFTVSKKYWSKKLCSR